MCFQSKVKKLPAHQIMQLKVWQVGVNYKFTCYWTYNFSVNFIYLPGKNTLDF